MFDLVKPAKSDLVTAVFWALGQCLICDWLEIAKQVAFGSVRHKVVTWDGALIEATGTLTGGGDPKKGLVNIDNKNI